MTSIALSSLWHAFLKQTAIDADNENDIADCDKGPYIKVSKDD
jgi:hypothetical protein